jgi:hypothetical protein
MRPREKWSTSGGWQPNLNQAAVVFHGDHDTDTRRWAVRHLRSLLAACFAESVSVPAWGPIPSIYIVCAQDMPIPADLQRKVFASKAREVLELSGSFRRFSPSRQRSQT